jgi:hypothetical protein
MVNVYFILKLGASEASIRILEVFQSSIFSRCVSELPRKIKQETQGLYPAVASEGVKK